MVDFIQRHKRILDIAACLSLATVFVVTLLRFFPPLFYGAGVVGDLFFDFGMAFLTAWTFHFMVVELPERRLRENAFRVVSFRLGTLASAASLIRADLSRAGAVGITLGEAQPQQHQQLMRAFLEQANNSSATGRSSTAPMPPALETITSRHAKLRASFDSIASLLITYFDPDIYEAAETVVTSAIFRLAPKADWHNEQHLRSLAVSLDMLQASCDQLRVKTETIRATGPG